MTPNGSPIPVPRSHAGVASLSSARDRNGRLWASVSHYRTGMSIGWVYREFLACY